MNDVVAYIDPALKIVSLLAGFGAFIWAAQAWFNAKFSALQKFVTDRIDRLEAVFTAKLEYHERHDDQRFESVDKEVMAIRLRNAARDGLAINLLEDINRLDKQTSASPKETSRKPSL